MNSPSPAPSRKRALVSVSDKTGLAAFAAGLVQLGFEIVSTGGTRRFLEESGIAVVDVDYRGSTGYGRKYRDRLHGTWGVVDVEDCAAVVRYLVEQGLADKARAVITGGSAGGYTTLACLTAEDSATRSTFRAGSSYYGVSDPAALARDTHKFESRYLDWLIAPYTDPDPAVQARHGWGLKHWQYDLVPWGVRFRHHDARGQMDAEVVAVKVHESDSFRVIQRRHGTDDGRFRHILIAMTAEITHHLAATG